MMSSNDGLCQSLDETEKTELISIPFPFKPYHVQTLLMETIYKTIEDRKIGVFESPTGTGKSLSILCSSLHWLSKKPYKSLQCNKDNTTIEEERESLPNWLTNYDSLREAEAASEVQKKLELLNKKLKKQICRDKCDENDLSNENYRIASASKKQCLRGGIPLRFSDINDENYILEDYHSDDIGKSMNSCIENSSESECSDREFDLLEKYSRKIIYASRTHSQTSQFVNEAKKTSFANKVRCISLGSRKNCCIHPKISRLKSDAHITESCKELIKRNKKSCSLDIQVDEKQKNSASGCKFFSKKLMKIFQNEAFSSFRNMEELVDLGRTLNVCPYFGMREALSLAELIVVPYASLLHHETRASLGISVKDNVVIIDEAHNVVEAINSCHCIELSLQDIHESQDQLNEYNTRYSSRMKGRNIFYVNILMSFMECLVKFIKRQCAVFNEKNMSEVCHISDFIFKASMDNINIFKLKNYIKMSKICHKVAGFNSENKVEETMHHHAVTSPLYKVQSFIEMLTNANKDGRILTSIKFQNRREECCEASVKYVVLNPAVYFEDIVKEAHSVILIGGTMEPSNYILDVLMPDSDRCRINFFSGGHVVPPENVLAMSVKNGPTGRKFNFTFSKRAEYDQMQELSRLLLNICRIVPGGVICFFQSFNYLGQVYDHLTTCGGMKDIMKFKSIFTEPKSMSEVDPMLCSYGKSATVGKGAILFAVVGAKMSEGINFSDELARCVLMIGLPYPDANDPELQLKMEFAKSCRSKKHHPGQPSLYETLCMRTVNQSIGRSIRHANDYSTILLVDERYAKENIVSQLPRWIGDRYFETNVFDEVITSLCQFFKRKGNI